MPIVYAVGAMAIAAASAFGYMLAVGERPSHRYFTGMGVCVLATLSAAGFADRMIFG